MIVASNYGNYPKSYNVIIKVEKLEESEIQIEDFLLVDEKVKAEPLDSDSFNIATRIVRSPKRIIKKPKVVELKPKRIVKKPIGPRLKISAKKTPSGESTRIIRRSTADYTARVKAEKAKAEEEKLKKLESSLEVNKDLLQDSLGVTNEPQKPLKKLGPQPDNEDDARIKETVNMSCDLCGIPIIRFSHVIYHFKKFHKPTKGYLICCGKKYKKRYRLVEHMNSHYNIQYPCEFCDKKFYTKPVLQKHMMRHTSEKIYVSLKKFPKIFQFH
jgi:hypothetical protein